MSGYEALVPAATILRDLTRRAVYADYFLEATAEVYGEDDGHTEAAKVTADDWTEALEAVERIALRVTA